MASARIWDNRCNREGPCGGCPGTTMGYPVVIGPSRSPVAIIAQDPNYTFSTGEAIKLHNELLDLASSHAPWNQLERRIWRCRSIDPENRLARIRRKIAELAAVSVDRVYFTNVAKCGERGAYVKPDRGKLNERMRHCRAYLDNELATVGHHTTIVFGRPSVDAVADVFKVTARELTEDGEFCVVGGRHLAFFKHWGRATARFWEFVTLRKHFARHPVSS